MPKRRHTRLGTRHVAAERHGRLSVLDEGTTPRHAASPPSDPGGPDPCLVLGQGPRVDRNAYASVTEPEGGADPHGDRALAGAVYVGLYVGETTENATGDAHPRHNHVVSRACFDAPRHRADDSRCGWHV